MALEYRLQVKTKMSLSSLVESYLNEKRILFSKENITKGENVYCYEGLGFMVSILFSEKIFFEYLISENKTIEEDWDYSIDIHFRLDKFYDNLLARINMIDMCIYLLNNTREDARLLFNGDILVLERTNGIISINKNFGFWNSDDLLNKINLLT
ncbi:hypothetical protein GCM10011506_44340 [Marivirga lumbricoides]|uniref:Immunity protein 63 domain-containing protein n=1 Tax=Marivirga lumbricoides TaxID=1046115 RepID=A0ABQ1N7T4_9BACT|nr:hypothetical protein GCM10011506_44340 [Marivirga lumbricoides]